MTVIVDDAGTPQTDPRPPAARARGNRRLLVRRTGAARGRPPGAGQRRRCPDVAPAGSSGRGSSARGRVLAADATLRRAAAAALPIRLRLTTTVDGRRLETRRAAQRARRSPPRDAEPNRAAVHGLRRPCRPRTGRPGPRSTPHRCGPRSRRRPTSTCRCQGEPRPRSFVVDAPFAVSGQLRLPASTLENVEVRGGTVRSGAPRASVRFETVLTGSRRSAVVVLAGDGSGDRSSRRWS